MKSSANRSVMVVHLDPTAVHASWAPRGSEPRRVHIPLVISDWASAWESGLRPFDSALDEAVSKLRVPPGTPVFVGFESQSSVAEAQSIPAGDSGTGLSSLRLAACERLTLPRHTSAVRVKQVCAATGGDKPSNGVALVSAASEEDVEAVRAWIGRAGLRCRLSVPAGAVLLAEITREITRDPSPVRIVLHIDGHRSVLGVATEGRIELLRTFEIGVNSFADAIARASQSRQEGRGMPLSIAQALESLSRNGFPKPDTMFDEEAKLTANAVLPVLQPVVQRFCVEVKQSLRMVLRRSATEPTVEMRGPGARIARMSEVFVNSVDAEFISPAPDSTERSLEVLLREPGWHDMALTSAAALQAASGVRFRRAVIAGAAIGFLGLGLEAGHYFRSAAELSSDRRAVDARLVQVHEFNELSRQAVDLDQRLKQGQDLLTEFVGLQPDWNAVVTELAIAAEPRVEITEFRAASEKDRAFLMIYGVADADEESAGLMEFIRVLGESPLVDRIDVESRLLIELGDRSVYQFRLRVNLHRLRPELTALGASR